MKVDMEKDLNAYFEEDAVQNHEESSVSEDLRDEEHLRKLWRYWRERAMNFLVRREYSEVELRQKLTQRACPSWLLEEIITWLYAQRYLSLERFAYSYAKNRADLGYGPIRVRHELSGMHQISAKEIDAAFAEINWHEARATAERKIRQTDPYKYRAALYRRGFSGDDYAADDEENF